MLTKDAETKKELEASRRHVAEYLNKHPSLKIVAVQPDRIERVNTPEKLKAFQALIKEQFSRPSSNYIDPTIESDGDDDGQTVTYLDWVGDKPVNFDYDSDNPT